MRGFARLAGPAIAAFLCVPAAAQAPAPASAAPAAPSGPMTVYTLAPAGGWTSCSTADVTLSMELNGSPRRPIKAIAGPGQTVCLRHASFATAGYRKLAFLIHGGSAGGQQISVMATVNGQPVTGKAKAMTLAANGWTKAEVPLATLGAENQTIDGILFQNTAATAAPPFYVTEIFLTP
jgi:hypothetical protein